MIEHKISNIFFFYGTTWKSNGKKLWVKQKNFKQVWTLKRRACAQIVYWNDLINHYKIQNLWCLKNKERWHFLYNSSRRIKWLPPEIWFSGRNFKIFRFSLQYTHLFPWIRVKEAFSRFENARNRFFAWFYINCFGKKNFNRDWPHPL
jgi:hypothetical protein